MPYRGAKAWGKFEKLVASSQKKLDLKRVKLIKDVHSLSEESLILDIGCGNPTFLKAFQKKVNCQTMGIDFSDKVGKIKPIILKINLQVAEIKDLSSNLRPDVITMWHYLEHDYTPFENLSFFKSNF